VLVRKGEEFAARFLLSAFYFPLSAFCFLCWNILDGGDQGAQCESEWHVRRDAGHLGLTAIHFTDGQQDTGEVNPRGFAGWFWRGWIAGILLQRSVKIAIAIRLERSAELAFFSRR